MHPMATEKLSSSMSKFMPDSWLSCEGLGNSRTKLHSSIFLFNSWEYELSVHRNSKDYEVSMYSVEGQPDALNERNKSFHIRIGYVPGFSAPDKEQEKKFGKYIDLKLSEERVSLARRERRLVAKKAIPVILTDRFFRLR